VIGINCSNLTTNIGPGKYYLTSHVNSENVFIGVLYQLFLRDDTWVLMKLGSCDWRLIIGQI